MELSLESLNLLHGDSIPDNDLWSSPNFSSSNCSFVICKRNSCDFISVLIKMSLSVSCLIIDNAKSSCMVCDWSIKEILYIVSSFVSFVAMYPLNLSFDVRSSTLVLWWFCEPCRRLKWSFPWHDFELVFLHLFLVQCFQILVLIKILSLLNSLTGKLLFLFLSFALVCEVFFNKCVFNWIGLKFFLNSFWSLDFPNKDRLVISSNRDKEFILCWESNPRDLWSMPSKFLGGRIFFSARIFKKFD